MICDWLCGGDLRNKANEREIYIYIFFCAIFFVPECEVYLLYKNINSREIVSRVHS